MAKNIEPNLVKIGEYLKLQNDTKFIIPEYQRKYSWEIQHCDKLWSDIVDYKESDSRDPYFFGTVIMNCSNDDTEFSLIDGQQRTTTFMLLLKALLMRINEHLEKMFNDPDSEQLRRALRERRRNIISILYKKDAEDISDDPNEENDKLIYNSFSSLENKSNQEVYKEELKKIMCSLNYKDAENNTTTIPYRQKDNRYTNFFRNFRHFYNKNELTYSPFLNKFSKILLEECQIIQIKSWKVEQAITMFNSLNSDGMPLTDSDIIYSKMFASAKDDDERNILGEKWRSLIDITNILENKKIINLNALLNQKMYFHRCKNGDTKNASGNIDVTTPGLRRYYTDINPGLIKEPLKFCDELLILAEMWNIVKDSNAIKVILSLNDNSKLFLASYFCRYDSLFTFDEGHIAITDENKSLFIQEIEKVTEPMIKLFTILSLVDAGYSSSNFKSFLFLEQIELVDPNKSIEKINKDFKEHINNHWERTEIENKLKDYQKNDIVYLKEYLFAKKNNKVLCISNDIDIEHIMPQSGKNTHIIQQDANINSDEVFDEYVNKIGNKILLEYNINRSIGNEWFRTKISTSISEKSGYVDSNYPIAQHLVQLYKNEDKKYWTKEDIEKATDDASKMISDFIFE